MTKVLTEQEAKQTAILRAYDPTLVISLTLRISNILYNEMKEETEQSGYSALSEFVKQAIREKIYYDKLERANLEAKQRTAMGY